MRVFSAVLTVGLMLGLSGCATNQEGEDLSSVPDAPESISDTTETEEVPSAYVEPDPTQPNMLLEAAEVSLARAISGGYVETVVFPDGSPPSVIVYDPSRPAGEEGALLIEAEFALPYSTGNVEDLMSGLSLVRTEASAMVNLMQTGGQGAAEYTNIVSDDGFMFASMGSGDRVHVVLDAEGLIQSYTSSSADGDLVTTFRYQLSQEEKDLIESAYAFEDSEIIYD